MLVDAGERPVSRGSREIDAAVGRERCEHLDGLGAQPREVGRARRVGAPSPARAEREEVLDEHVQAPHVALDDVEVVQPVVTNQPFRVVFVPEPACCIETPSTLRVLGCVTMPFSLAFELFGPIGELVSLASDDVGRRRTAPASWQASSRCACSSPT